MAQVLFPGRRFTDTNGNPINGGLLEVFEAGTTTPLDTYTDSALTTPAANPIVLDSAGQMPVIYVAPDDYKFVLKSSDEATTYFTIDNYTVIDPATATAVATTSITTNTTVAADDLNRLFSVDTSSGAITITADSATLGSGFEFSVVKVTSDADAVTITGTGAQVINGAATYSLDAQYDSATFRSNGAGGWDILAQTLDTTTLVNDNAIQKLQVALHCGRFEYSSATIVKLAPFNGNYICFPNGDSIAIGASGVSSTYNNATINGTAAQTLTADTTYYAYVYNNSGTLVIDWSTTAPAWDSATGIRIKTGDATRVLVGMVRTNSSSQFDDSVTKRHVASWNNRRPRHLVKSFASDRTYASATWGQINSAEIIEFLSWGDAAEVTFNAIVSASGIVNRTFYSGVILDATSGTPTYMAALYALENATFTGEGGASVTGQFEPSVGYHYATALANHTSSASGSYVTESTLVGKVVI